MEQLQHEAKVTIYLKNLMERSSNIFILSAGVIVLITGVAKILSALGKSPVLWRPDPIFGIQFNIFLLSAGIIEIVVALICLSTTVRNLALVLLAALSINFLGYRMALRIINWQGYCPCLGTLPQALHLSRHTADLLTSGVFTFLISGSLLFLTLTNKMQSK